MNASEIKNYQELISLGFTQRWTNIGLTITFFFVALFTYAILNLGFPNWWVNLVDSKFLSIVLSFLLIFPVGYLLLLSITIFESVIYYQTRIVLLIIFSLFISFFIVYISSSLSDITIFFNSYDIGIFFVYLSLILFALFFLDSILITVVHISQSHLLLIFIEIIKSLPFILVIWKVTGNAWIFLTLFFIFTIFNLYFAKAAITWIDISKAHIGNCVFVGRATPKCPKGLKINILHNNNYKNLGVYLSLYNFSPNLFLLLDNDVESFDIVTDVIDEVEEENKPYILNFLYESNKNLNISNELTNEDYSFVLATFNKKKNIYRIISAIIFYISFCFILYFMGNLFEA